MRDPAVELAFLILGGAIAILALQLVVVAFVSRPHTRRILDGMSRRSSLTSRRTKGMPARRQRAMHPSVDRRPGLAQSREDVESFVRACEEFLTGTYVETPSGLDRDAPLAWLNQLAHATAAQLEELASQSWHGSRRAPEATWHDAASFLARELLGHSGGDKELLALQRSILVPLELSALDYRAAMPGPEGLSRLVLARLEAHERHGA